MVASILGNHPLVAFMRKHGHFRWIPPSRNFNVDFTCVNKIRDDVRTACVNVKT